MATTEAPFSLTYKMTSPEGAEFLITARPNITTTEEQLEAIQEIDKQVKDLKAMGFTPAAGYGKSYAAKAAPQGDADAPQCECGVNRQFKSGTSKAGKAWKGYSCVNRKCDMKWIN